MKFSFEIDIEDIYDGYANDNDFKRAVFDGAVGAVVDMFYNDHTSVEDVRSDTSRAITVWEDFPIEYQRGSCCYKVPSTETVHIKDRGAVSVQRNKWVVDCDIPVFTQDREFVQKWI